MATGGEYRKPACWVRLNKNKASRIITITITTAFKFLLRRRGLGPLLTLAVVRSVRAILYAFSSPCAFYQLKLCFREAIGGSPEQFPSLQQFAQNLVIRSHHVVSGPQPPITEDRHIRHFVGVWPAMRKQSRICSTEKIPTLFCPSDLVLARDYRDGERSA